jgi:hypothetical protein
LQGPDCRCSIGKLAPGGLRGKEYDPAEGQRSDYMLPRRLGKPHVMGPAQATASDAPGVRALNPCPPCILGVKLSDLLPLPRNLNRYVLSFRPDGELAWSVYRPREGALQEHRLWLEPCRC